MSDSMARQGCRVLQEQSDIRLALNMAKLANGGLLFTALKETQQLIKKLCAAVQDETKWGVEFPGHNKVNAAIPRHQTIVYKNHTDCSLPCQNGTAKNPQTHWMRIATVSPPLELVALLPGIPHLPGTPTAPPSDCQAIENDEIEGIPSRCVYIHSLLPNTQFVIHHAHAKKIKHVKWWPSDEECDNKVTIHRFSKWSTRGGTAVVSQNLITFPVFNKEFSSLTLIFSRTVGSTRFSMLSTSSGAEPVTQILLKAIRRW